jgi:hypothetical protein
MDDFDEGVVTGDGFEWNGETYKGALRWLAGAVRVRVRAPLLTPLRARRAARARQSTTPSR